MGVFLLIGLKQNKTKQNVLQHSLALHQLQNLRETIILTCICVIRTSDKVSLIIAILTAYHTAKFYY